MELVTDQGVRIVASGTFKVYIGGSSPGNRSTELNKKPVNEASFTLR